MQQLVIYYVPALIFAFVFQRPDWPALFEDVYGYPMIDREVYTNKLIYYDLPTDYLPHFDTRMYFTFEWMWNTSISYLHRNLGLEPEQIFSIISTLVLWRFAFEIATRVGWVYVLLLINPLVVDFACSQLRLAVAISILSFFWRGQHGAALTVAVYVAAASIHTAVALFAVMHLAAHWLNQKKLLHLILLIALGFLISIAVGPLRELFLATLGDRRAEVDYERVQSTLAYLSFWVLLWGMLLARWRSALTSLDGRYAVVILSIVALNSIFGGYSTRFIVAAFPSLIISMVAWKSRPVSLPLLLFLPYSGVQWLYWFRILGG